MFVFTMTKNEMIVNFRYDRDRWHIIKLICARLMCATEKGDIIACTGGSVIRELLNEWLDEKSFHFYPVLLKDFQKQGIQNQLTAYIKECIIDYAESAKINKDSEDIAELRKSLQNASFTKEEISEIIKEEEEK